MTKWYKGSTKSSRERTFILKISKSTLKLGKLKPISPSITWNSKNYSKKTSKWAKEYWTSKIL